MSYQAHHTAVIDDGAKIGDGTKIWHFTHVTSGAVVGKNCSIGQGCYIDDVIIGDRVRIQNNVSVYKSVEIEDDAFVGPSVVFINDLLPPSKGKNWLPTKVCKGSIIGANATILCGVVLGEGSMVGAGSVVTKNVHPGTYVIGNPAKFKGLVSVLRDTVKIRVQDFDR